VQAYDQRFNDMQTLIVTLDERCSNTTRLVSLAQQCTQELRTEGEDNLLRTKHDLQREIDQVQRAFKELFGRVAGVEQGVAGSKVTEEALEKRVLHLEDSVRATDKRAAESEAVLRLECGTNVVRVAAVEKDVELLKGLKDDIHAVEKSLGDRLTSVEGGLIERQVADRDEFSRRLVLLQNQLTGHMESEESKHAAADVKIDDAMERAEESLKRGTLYRDRLNEHFDMLEKVGERIGFLENSVGDLRREEGRPLEARLEKKLGDKADALLKQRFGDMDAWADGFEKRIDGRMDSMRAHVFRAPPPAVTVPTTFQQYGGEQSQYRDEVDTMDMDEVNMSVEGLSGPRFHTQSQSHAAPARVGASVLAHAGPGPIKQEVFAQFIDMYESELAEVRGRLDELNNVPVGSGSGSGSGNSSSSSGGGGGHNYRRTSTTRQVDYDAAKKVVSTTTPMPYSSHSPARAGTRAKHTGAAAAAVAGDPQQQQQLPPFFSRIPALNPPWIGPNPTEPTPTRRSINLPLPGDSDDSGSVSGSWHDDLSVSRSMEDIGVKAKAKAKVHDNLAGAAAKVTAIAGGKKRGTGLLADLKRRGATPQK
jgi:hypothetical protein